MDGGLEQHPASCVCVTRQGLMGRGVGGRLRDTHCARTDVDTTAAPYARRSPFISCTACTSLHVFCSCTRATNLNGNRARRFLWPPVPAAAAVSCVCLVVSLFGVRWLRLLWRWRWRRCRCCGTLHTTSTPRAGAGAGAGGGGAVPVPPASRAPRQRQ